MARESAASAFSASRLASSLCGTPHLGTDSSHEHRQHGPRPKGHNFNVFRELSVRDGNAARMSEVNVSGLASFLPAKAADAFSLRKPKHWQGSAPAGAGFHVPCP